MLSRTTVPGAPWKIAIATRVVYQPGARVRKYYHTSQVVFYILEGAMVVQDEGKDPVTLRPGSSLLIKPGTVHEHWNASSSANLVFTEDRRRHSARPGRVDIRPSNVCLGCTTNTCESKISEATVAYPPDAHHHYGALDFHDQPHRAIVDRIRQRPRQRMHGAPVSATDCSGMTWTLEALCT